MKKSDLKLINKAGDKFSIYFKMHAKNFGEFHLLIYSLFLNKRKNLVIELQPKPQLHGSISKSCCFTFTCPKLHFALTFFVSLVFKH